MKKGNVIILCLLLTISFGTVAVWGTVDVWKGRQSVSWPTATGTVFYKKSDITPGTALEYIRVVYLYRVGDSDFQSERLSFNSFDSVADDFAMAAKVGQEVRVHYNPDKPSQSVLYPGADIKESALVVVFGVFAGLGLYATWRVHKDFLQ